MECRACDLLFELFERTSKSDRDYWIVTELFVNLHDGRDFCDKARFQKTAMCSMPSSGDG